MCPFHLTTSPQGTNPRGLQANELWQADFTHYKLPPFKLLFVVIDTFSGFIWAVPSAAETTKAAVTALLQCFSVMGIPVSIKTDNGPAFTANAFRDFMHQWGICHLTGIPYDPQGQAVIERAHRTLKLVLNKQNRGNRLRDPYGPKAILPIALLTINYFNLPLHSQETRAERHFSDSLSHMPEQTAVWVKCLDQWWPGTLKLLGKGYCLVILDDGTEQWVPLRSVRRRAGLVPHPLTSNSTKTEIAADDTERWQENEMSPAQCTFSYLGTNEKSVQMS